MEKNIKERKLNFKNYNLKSVSFKEHNLKSTNYQNHILENNTGITLIALIVTIIVLLILAGVSISAIWGGEGIFSRTTLAKNITSLVIEDNVKTIGTSAFVNCTSIQQLNIGKGVDNINLNWSWNGAMKKLSSVTIDNENNKFCAIDNIIYTKKENKVYKLVLVPNGVTDFKIQTGVKVIGTLAFSNRLIDTIMIPSGVEEIEDTAFRYSTVNKITIPNSIKTMGANALRDCPNLKRVEIDKKENELKDPQNNCWGAGAGARVVHWLQ